MDIIQKNQLLKNRLISVLFLLLSGCGTSTLKIDTNPPGADVYVKTVGSTDRRLLGKTPIPRTLTKDIQKGQLGSLMLDVELENYQSTSVLIAEAGNSESEISLQLKPMAADKKAENDSAKINKNLDQLFEAQRLARIGRHDDALKILDEISKEFPQWASVPEMRGGIFLLQKNYVKALDEYKKSVALNTDNTSSQAIIKNLEKRVGIKATDQASTKVPPVTPDKSSNTGSSN